MEAYSFKMQSKDTGYIPIPSVFIDEYMPQADGNFVKVYLTGLYEALKGCSFSGDHLSQKLGLIESDILKAFEYWESKGLLRLQKSDNNISIEFLNLYSPYLSGECSQNNNHIYTPESINQRMDNPNIKDMFESIEKLLTRTLSANEFSMYLSWLDDYSFPPEVIILLIEYCRSRNKVDLRYIEKVAIGWHEAGIKSSQDAQRHISQHEDKYNNYRLVLDFLGLRENEIMKPQEEFLNKWFGTWEFSFEMVLEACRICSIRINEPNFSYIDGILSNWYKKGIKNVTDVESIDPKKKSKNVKFKAPVNAFNSYDQRSYDIKDLEKKLRGIDEEVGDEQ